MDPNPDPDPMDPNPNPNPDQVEVHRTDGCKEIRFADGTSKVCSKVACYALTYECAYAPPYLRIHYWQGHPADWRGRGGRLNPLGVITREYVVASSRRSAERPHCATTCECKGSR
eukprot:scaffold13430_cov43-Phaeocystis_antarctica.AAC.2